MAPASRPFASLSSSLLARKGQARPAMRPQGFLPTGDQPATSLDDLGWNDMGWSQPEPEAAPAPMPEVRRQQRELAAEFEPAAPVIPLPIEPVRLTPLPAKAEAAPQLVSRATGKARTAFTLRLDPARHLRLRLACATRRLSAQKLLVTALDQLLAGMPDIEPLAQTFPASGEATPSEDSK